MKCYVCLRMKQEDRILDVQDALTVRDGLALCECHIRETYPTGETLRAVEAGRDGLRNWWTARVLTHGEFNHRKQTFADGTTYVEAGGY